MSTRTRARDGALAFDAAKPGWATQVNLTGFNFGALLIQVFGNREQALKELSRVCPKYGNPNRLLAGLGLKLNAREEPHTTSERYALVREWLAQIKARIQ